MSETKVWIRTCQECGHQQAAKEPRKDRALSKAYELAKCKKCKSESLDYGTYPSPEVDEE